MRILIYAAVSPDAPAGKKLIARILHNDGSPVPVVFEGSDPEALTAKAEAWWSKELARLNPNPRKAKPPSAEVAVNTRAAETKITRLSDGRAITIPAGSTGHHPADPLGDIV